MSGLVFIGDELSAAGWRLAGLEIITPVKGSEEGVVREALAGASLLIMTSAVAESLSPALMEEALTATTLLTHVVTDIQDRHPSIDYAGQLRRQLGLGQ
jgi:hypothetical protein